jgi:hypothetical protein
LDRRVELADVVLRPKDQRGGELTPWLFVAGCLILGAALLAWGRARLRARNPIEEALPVSEIGELEPGRFRIVGRVVPIGTSPSAVDGADCVYAERAEYEMGAGLVPVLREVSHEAVSHRFFLEDATGRILVDPARTLIECGTAIGDAGLTAERRLRAGEEVSLAATFQRTQVDADGPAGPYRAGAQHWEAIADTSGPPRLSHRTAEGMVRPPPDDFTAFLGGAGAMMMLMGGLLAFIVAFVM